MTHKSKRDNGILSGLVGADIVWPTCGMPDGRRRFGDAYLLNGVRGVQPRHDDGLFEQAPGPEGWPRPAIASLAKQGVPAPEPTTGRKIKDGNFEILDGWNVVEVIWPGDRAAHIVNGRLVNVVTTLQEPEPNQPRKFIPLTRGKIAIEIEYAEIWFRKNRGEVARVMRRKSGCPAFCLFGKENQGKPGLFWSRPGLFTQRSPPRLFTAAAQASLRAASESRSRGACPHLLRSFTTRISFHLLLLPCFCSTHAVNLSPELADQG